MKLKEIIEKIDKTDVSIQAEPDWEELGNIFELFNFYWFNDKRLKAYYVKVHYCTDSYVGIKAYFLDDVFVAISNQTGRKSKEYFKFISDEKIKETYEYLVSLQAEDEPELSIEILNLDTEMGDSYKVEYNTDILHKFALLNGEKVEIIKKRFDVNIHHEDYFHSVIIKHGDGREEKINCKDLDFEYNKGLR